MPQQFVVPQFIDSEASIIGPVTVRQFLILIVTTLICAIFYMLADFTLFLILASPVAIIGLVIAFVKINGQNFHFFILNMLQTWRKPRLRVWQRQLSEDDLRRFVKIKPPEPKAAFERKHFVNSSRLNELSLIVNTGGTYRPEADDVL